MNYSAKLTAFKNRCLRILPRQLPKRWKIKHDLLLLIYVADSALYFFTLQKQSASAWKLTDYRCERRRTEDPCFTEEVLYMQLKNYPTGTGVLLSFAPAFYTEKNFIFPALNKEELAKALNWEKQNLPSSCFYNHHCTPTSGGCEVKLLGLELATCKYWSKLLKENSACLLDIVIPAPSASPVPLTIPKDLLPPGETDFWHDYLALCLSGQIALLPASYRACRYRWPLIFSQFLGLLLCLSTMLYCYGYFSLNKLKAEVTRSRSQVQLLQPDLDLAREIHSLEGKIKAKEKLVSKLSRHPAGLYPLLQQLASLNIDGVALTKVSLENKSVSIEGKALNYTLLNEYRNNLQKATLLTGLSLVAAQKSQDQSYLTFTLQGEIQ